MMKKSMENNQDLISELKTDPNKKARIDPNEQSGNIDGSQGESDFPRRTSCTIINSLRVTPQLKEIGLKNTFQNDVIRRNDQIQLEIDDEHDQDGTVNFDPRTT
jgi:hypothetical protein|tara:strand:+ start:123 stop:434 length:312 start_codon:yes stop_codon:yes gene_type:complete